MIIAIHSTKGGVGSSTLAAHLCVVAKDLGYTVDAMSADPTQELPRWLTPLDIKCLEPEGLDGPASSEEADLLVIDVQTASKPQIEPDVWLIPVPDKLGLEHAKSLTDRLRGDVFWLPMMGFEVTRPNYLEEVELLPAVPYSRAIAKAGSQLRTVWSVADLALSPGAQALRESLTQFLTTQGLPRQRL